MTPHSRWMRPRLVPIIVHLSAGVLLSILVVLSLCAFRPMRRITFAPSNVLVGPQWSLPGSEWHGQRYHWMTSSWLGTTRCGSWASPDSAEDAERNGVPFPPIEYVAAGNDDVPPAWAQCHDLLTPPDRPFSSVSHDATLLFQTDDVAFGWPLRCLHARASRLLTVSGRELSSVAHGVLLDVPFLKTNFNHDGLWPTHVLWMGLLGNVLFWSIVSMLPRLAWRRYKKVVANHRKEKGLCTACGYDRSATSNGSACPECGALNN